MAQWLSWLERRPVTAEVVGSSPIWVVLYDITEIGIAHGRERKLAAAHE